MSNWDEQLDLLIRARTPIIWIRSNEEERVETLLKNATKRLAPRRLATWDYIDGISNCLLYTSPSPRDTERSRMPSSA